VELSVEETPGGAVVRVVDDGPGIPAADRERAFGRFTRLDEARSRDRGGTGLGLAIVRELVLRRGGEVRLGESSYGGLSVEITLPA
jgi:signal transduction histidine kinase